MGPEPMIVIVCSVGIVVTLWRCVVARPRRGDDINGPLHVRIDR